MGDVITSPGEGQSAQMQQLQQLREKAMYNNIGVFVAMLIYGAIFYCLVVQHYPELDESDAPTKEAQKFSRKNEVSACCDGLTNGHWTNCLLSFFCTGPRAAMTFDKVGVLSYWPALLLMSFPLTQFFTLCYFNACTDLNVRLGGKKRGCFMSCLCTFFCTRCVIYQDAVALDMTTGAEIGCCGVDTSAKNLGSESD